VGGARAAANDRDDFIRAEPTLLISNLCQYILRGYLHTSGQE
jgi:hypothetical protein